MDDTVKTTINTALISALTIAAALIWKDVITGLITLFVPQQDALLFKFFAAVLATVLVIFGIYALINTEKEAELVVTKLSTKKKAPPPKGEPPKGNL